MAPDSKPLVEANKALAEAIGSLLTMLIVCNRHGTQIVHHQMQKHAQNFMGAQPQAQQEESVQDAAAPKFYLLLIKSQIHVIWYALILGDLLESGQCEGTR
uniref:Uncharacterized protein n=1 Tax=Nelumbo nucifera TaxID=4432 RepID=A0A822YCE6_NELNU|nr:TPA_asm: hypothetical protein HUJ06_030659 [Nelumbo nucifera]